MGMEDAAAALAQASTPVIIGTGLLLGVVHVLTGPDHLSALIVLSAGSSWRSCQLGMRWGCGHSTGLVVVTAVFLAVNRHLDIERFGSYCDFMVGFLMIALGLWSLRHYLLLRHKLQARREHHLQHHQHEAATEKTPLRLEAGDKSSSSSSSSEEDDDVEVRKILHEHGTDHDDATATAAPRSFCFGLCAADIKNPRTQQLTAFLYGTAHGLAGTGGILGVLPAVILNDWVKSWAYLGAFCLASILVMGAFAAVYGEVTGRMSRFSDASLVRVGVFSSCVSLTVGVLWVVLVSTGTLDEVFG
jgi:ABC-type nickel/cobalt efflux system permease component RcnA